MSGCVTDAAPEDSITYDMATLQNVTRITGDQLQKDWLAVSPDGGKILYCESEKLLRWEDISNDLYGRGKPGEAPLVSDYSYAPSWYGDNSSFVYVVYEGGLNKLVRSNISGCGRWSASWTTAPG